MQRKSVKIGSCRIDTNMFLAPMSGCTDLPFRLIAREHGAKFAFFEMLDANAIVYHARGNSVIMKTDERDRPIAAQLVGGDPEIMLTAARMAVEWTSPAFIDINAACPVKKMIKKKAGSSLLRDQDRLCGIIEKLAGSLPLPVTVKLRTGYEKRDVKVITEIAKNCEKSGAAAIFIHGRLRSQGYSGEVDYDAIKAVKECVSVPVFGSGNVFTPALAKEMLLLTGCDGVMVARGALGNPWIFPRIEEYFRTGHEAPPVGLSERLSVLKKHLAYMKELRETNERSLVGRMRKVCFWYLSAIPEATRIRREVNRLKSYDELLLFINSLPLPDAA